MGWVGMWTFVWSWTRHWCYAEHGEILINTFDPGNGDGKTRCVLTCWKKQHRSTCTMITGTGKAKKGPDFVWKGCQTQDKWPFFTLRRLRNTERVVIFWQWWCAYTRDSAPGGMYLVNLALFSWLDHFSPGYNFGVLLITSKPLQHNLNKSPKAWTKSKRFAMSWISTWMPTKPYAGPPTPLLEKHSKQQAAKSSTTPETWEDKCPSVAGMPTKLSEIEPRDWKTIGPN